MTAPVFPGLGALNFFLAFWMCLPHSVQSFVTLAITLVLCSGIIRVVMD